MSTRSRIAVKNDDGTYRSIYCHHAPDLNFLLTNYIDPAKVDQLIGLGALSYVGKEIGERHSFKLCNTKFCLAYMRDRGEASTSFNVSTVQRDLASLMDACSECDADELFIYEIPCTSHPQLWKRIRRNNW